MHDPDVEVLIAGAGPTGLACAAALGARGVSCLLIDPLLEPSPTSRALIVHARTLELLQLWGLGERLVARGSPSLRMEAWVAGRPAVELNIHDLGIQDTRFPVLLTLSQAETERALLEHAAAVGVSPARGQRLVSFTQDEAGVSATLDTPSGPRTVRARWLVGADGAHSAVRKGLGLRFEGDRYPQDFVVADVQVEGVPRDRVVLQVQRDHMLAWFPLPDRMRLMTIREPSEVEAPAPTLAELQARVDELSAYKATLQSASWMSAFRLHHRGVDSYRAGRVFVAGDAAHIHSPAGGQGMNTGIQDGLNLGWKLAQVALGEANPAILDSYEEERLPVGHRLLSFTDRLFKFATSTNPVLWTLRDLMARSVVPHVTSAPALRARAFRFASQLAIRYRHSALTRSAGAAPHPGPGERLPDAALTQPGGAPDRLHAQLDGLRWTLLAVAGPQAAPVELAAFDAQLAAALERWPAQATPVFVVREEPVGAPPPRRLRLDEAGALAERLNTPGLSLLLVRPDGHIAWRTEDWAVEPLERWLAQWLLPSPG